MKTMKRFAARICALFVVLTVSLTALMPAAFAATKAQLPDLPSSQCVVDDANILSSSTKTAIENLNAQLTQQCEGAQIGVLTVDAVRQAGGGRGLPPRHRDPDAPDHQEGGR